MGFINFSEKKLKKVLIHFVGVASFFSGSKIFPKGGSFSLFNMHCTQAEILFVGTTEFPVGE